MKIIKMKNFKLLFLFGLTTLISNILEAQTMEWQLNNASYSTVDPDGAGPATGSATFTLQIHTTSGTATNITGMSTGWSWQSAAAMVPTGAPCGSNSTTQPSNITMSSVMSGLGFTYNNVNECSGTVNYSTGGQTFNRRAVGTIDGGTINITTSWIDVFTVTMWSLGISNPEAGYYVINSSSGGTPGEFTTYSIADDQAIEYPANSLTYTTPLSIGSSLPVTFSSFDVTCKTNGTLISWATDQEVNSSHFIIEKSNDGVQWNEIGRMSAAGNSGVRRNYQFMSPVKGNLLFRVKQYDIDGQSIITNIKSSNCSGSNIPVTAYPVPAKDIVNVVINGDVSQKVQLILMDAVGKKVRNKVTTINAGQNNISINVSGLSAGQYILQVMRNNIATDNINIIKE